MVYVANVEAVKREDLTKGQAKLTKVRYLIDQRHGAERFFLRIYDVLPGGRTPLDKHSYEHEVFVLKGAATLITEKNGRRRKRKLVEGDFVFIGPHQLHQFVNDGDDTFSMICVRGSAEDEEKESGSIPC